MKKETTAYEFVKQRNERTNRLFKLVKERGDSKTFRSELLKFKRQDILHLNGALSEEEIGELLYIYEEETEKRKNNFFGIMPIWLAVLASMAFSIAATMIVMIILTMK